MTEYRIFVREVHIQEYTIEANNEQQAIDMVQDGQGYLDEQGFEYSHTLDTSLWTIRIEDTNDMDYKPTGVFNNV